MRVAVIGATGLAGQETLNILAERRFPLKQLIVFSSRREQTVTYCGVPLPTRTFGGLTDDRIKEFDLAFFATDEAVSQEWVPRFANQGVTVIDYSSQWRMNQAVPLVVAGVNDATLARHHGIIANPNCSTMQMVLALHPIHQAVGIDAIMVDTWQSVSGSGTAALQELEDGEPVAGVYPHPIVNNVLPDVGGFAPGGWMSGEEHKLRVETRRILDANIEVFAKCTRVPISIGHSESVKISTRVPLSPIECRRLLAVTPGIALHDNPGKGDYPHPLMTLRSDTVHVGLIRPIPPRAMVNGLDLWIVANNLRVGTALNAVRLAELLVERKLLHRNMVAA